MNNLIWIVVATGSDEDFMAAFSTEELAKQWMEQPGIGAAGAYPYELDNPESW